MSDSGSSWWLGADRLWRKGHPPSGWHQTRDGLWHPPPTAATRLKAEASSPDAGGRGPGPLTSGSTATIASAAERWQADSDDAPAAVSVYDDGGAEVGGDVDIDAHLDAEVDDAVDGDGDDLDGYETAYYEQAGAFGRDTIYAADDDGDDVDEEGRARHMAGGRSPELWAGLVDRISSWPIWLQLALPVSAMVILLGGIGIALADTGGGQPDRTASTETDDSGEHAAGDSLTTSSSSLSSTTTRPGASSSSTSSSLPGSTTTVAGGDGSTDGPPPGEGGAAGPPPSSSNPTSPSTTTARPPSTTTPTTAPQDPYRYCEGLERLFPTDPDGDGTYCE